MGISTKAHKCPRCGGPLTVEPEAHNTTCQYCGTSIAVQNKPRPKGPPPPVQAGAPVILYTGRSSGAGAFVALAITIMAVIGVSVAGAIAQSAARGASSPSDLLSDLGVTDTKLPAKCALNGNIVIKGQTADIPGVAVKASSNCKIRFINSTIKADKLVEADGPNVKVTLENTKVEARKVAFESSPPNLGVTLLQGSEITGDSAVKCGLNLDLKMEASKLDTTNDTIECDGSMEVRLTNSQIKSKKTAVDAGHAAKVWILEGSSILGRIGIKSEHSTELKIEKGYLRGTRTAAECRSIKVEASGKDSYIRGPTAIQAKHTATIDLEEGARIKATKVAVEAGHSVEIELSGSKIESKGDAVEAGHTAKVDLQEDSLIEAKKDAIVAGHSLEVELQNSKIVGGNHSIKSAYTAKVEADSGSEIVGKRSVRR